MQNTTRSRCLTTLALGCALAAAAAASGPAAKSSPWDYDFRSVVPLGYDALRLLPEKKTVYLLASAESAEFEGLRRRAESGRPVVTGRNGRPVERLPEAIDFRVTASARKSKLVADELVPFDVSASHPAAQFLLHLRFRLKIYNGLEERALEPAAVRLIGVPADVPYDERVYRVSFQVGKVAVTERIVLEVLDPDGNRVSKFYLGML